MRNPVGCEAALNAILPKATRRNDGMTTMLRVLKDYYQATSAFPLVLRFVEAVSDQRFSYLSIIG